MADNQKTQTTTVATAPENGQPAADDVWDEERLEKALKTLKELHIQLRNLRTTIPRFIEPLVSKHPSPEALFQAFTNAIETAQDEVQTFKTLRFAEDSQKIFEQATKSREENPTGIKSWKAKDHPDWLTRDT